MSSLSFLSTLVRRSTLVLASLVFSACLGSSEEPIEQAGTTRDLTVSTPILYEGRTIIDGRTLKITWRIDEHGADTTLT